VSGTTLPSSFTFTHGDDFAFLGLFFGGVGDDDAALGFLFLLDPLYDDAVL